MKNLSRRVLQILFCCVWILQACQSARVPLQERYDDSWNLIRRQIDASRTELNANAVIDAPFIDKDMDPVNARFNQEIQSIVDNEIELIYNDLTEPLDLEYPGSMGMSYQVTTSPTWLLSDLQSNNYTSPERIAGKDAILFAGHHILSVVFTTNIYFGGAHPASWHKTITYDLTTGERLDLNQLFRPFSSHLATIADYSIRDLSSHEQDLFPDYATNGAAPSEENYTDWAITSRGLLIIFEEYQVSPYVSGPQYILIPYDDLSGIIGPRGALSEFAK